MNIGSPRYFRGDGAELDPNTMQPIKSVPTPVVEADKELDELIWLLVPEERRGYAKEALKKFVDKAVVAELESMTGIANEIPEYQIRHRINQLKAIMEIKE